MFLGFAMRLIAAAVVMCVLSAGVIPQGPLASGLRGSGAKPDRPDLAHLSDHSRAQLFERIIAQAAREQGVDPKILWVIAYNETRFRPGLTSNKGAKGMMQFMPATAVRFGLHDPYEPIASINAAAKYVRYLTRLFGGRLDSVLAAYNAGEGTVLSYLSGKASKTGTKTINPMRRVTAGGVPPYRETVGYVTQGLKVYRWLESRGKFNGSFAKAVVPPSAMAPQVVLTSSHRKYSELQGSVVRPETGIADEIADMRQPSVPAASASGSGLSDNIRPATEERSAGIGKVFYEPWSGDRFSYGDGGKPIRLVKSGQRIISKDTRPVSSAHARTTFVGIRRKMLIEKYR